MAEELSKVIYFLNVEAISRFRNTTPNFDAIAKDRDAFFRDLLPAYLRARHVAVTELTEYFLDGQYRSNPLDYRPDQQVLTFTMSPPGVQGS